MEPLGAADAAFLAGQACIEALCRGAMRARCEEAVADAAAAPRLQQQQQQRAARMLRLAGGVRALIDARLLRPLRSLPLPDALPVTKAEAQSGGGGCRVGTTCGAAAGAGDHHEQQDTTSKQQQQQQQQAGELALKALAAWLNSSSFDAETRALVMQGCAAASGATAAAAVGKDDLRALAAAARAAREAALSEELREVAARAAEAGAPPENVHRLCGAVAALRRAEASLGFQARLAADAADAAAAEAQLAGACGGGGGDDGCGSEDDSNGDDGDGGDCFAYGSTPFASWLRVLRHPAVAPAVGAALFGDPPSPPAAATGEGADAEAAAAATAAPRGEQRRRQLRDYVVLGSSSGWLPLYAALGAGWRARGVELLPCLVAAARDAAARHGAAALAAFERGDLRTADCGLARAGVVHVTEQCWGEALRARAAARLAEELAPGSVVVDYTGGVARRLPGRLLAVVEAPFSWGRARMHAWLVEKQ